jgi:histidine triad (HIT) family protein
MRLGNRIFPHRLVSCGVLRVHPSWAWSTTRSLSRHRSIAIAAATSFTRVQAFPRTTTSATTPGRLSIRRDMSNNNNNDTNDEVARATAAAAKDPATETIFDKLLSGAWPSDVVYEDDWAFCFRDVNPQAPVHILCIPKVRDGLTQLVHAREDQKDLLGHLLYVAKEVARKECPEGYRIVINDGKDGAQSVYHLHLHILGGRQLQWPPG